MEVNICLSSYSSRYSCRKQVELVRERKESNTEEETDPRR
jgi:hypothetical protein